MSTTTERNADTVTGTPIPRRVRMIIELVPDEGGRGAMRLRRWLKIGLRQFGIKCREIAPEREELPKRQP